MEKFYLCTYNGSDVEVNSDLFAFYLGVLKYVLHYDILDEIKYLDAHGGKFRCFYYVDDEYFNIYVGFNNVEV